MCISKSCLSALYIHAYIVKKHFLQKCMVRNIPPQFWILMVSVLIHVHVNVKTVSCGWQLFVSLQEAIVKIMKMRKRITNAALQTELVEILRNMFLPSKKLIKEQIEWLIEHKYMKRDEENINMFIYMA